VGKHPRAADALRPKVELAEIVRTHAEAYRGAHVLVPVQHRALRAIESCRTEALGGHVAQCERCGVQRYHYHSCRNRHCPKCQSLARERWLAARRAELLPVPYFHLVFTVPHELNALAQGNPRALYGLLFQSVSDTLIEFGADSRWLGGRIALTLVLHTWGQTLGQHLHLHALVAAGALHRDGHWMGAREQFLFPVRSLSKVFRGKFLAGLKGLFQRQALRFASTTRILLSSEAQQRLLDTLYTKSWVTYAKRPFAGPEQVLNYLGRYTHRIALSNDRLLPAEPGQVRFRYKDYADGTRHKVMTLPAAEFLRRFLLHVLPRGFMRIRHYGILANRAKHDALAHAREALQCTSEPAQTPTPESPRAFWMRIAGVDINACAHCAGGLMRIAATIPSLRPPLRGPPW
jgi:hypothetical protein